MEVLSTKFPGRILICDRCGALLAYKEADIYGENLIYCPLCKFCNQIDYVKGYDGIIKNPKNLEENAKES